MPRIALMTRYSPLGASSRYRTYQYVPFLEREGFQVAADAFFDDGHLRLLYSGGRRSFSGLASAYGRRVAALNAARSSDVLFCEKELLPMVPYILERSLMGRRPALVVDLDDALFHNYDMARSPLVRALLGKKIDQIMRMATLTVAGNEYIAERAERAGCRWVEIVPSCVDLERYPPVDQGRRAAGPEGRPAPFTVGWIGTPVTSQYLGLVHSALRRSAEEGPVKLVVIGAPDFTMEGIDMEARPWSQESEVRDLAACDVGIMPLQDSPYERGKCGLKLIQYMAGWKPVVASPVGVNRTLVTPGENGYLASTEEEWTGALRALRGDAELCSRLGTAGRKRVEEGYSLSVCGPRLASLLAEAARRGRG